MTDPKAAKSKGKARYVTPARRLKIVQDYVTETAELDDTSTVADLLESLRAAVIADQLGRLG